MPELARPEDIIQIQLEVVLGAFFLPISWTSTYRVQRSVKGGSMRRRIAVDTGPVTSSLQRLFCPVKCHRYEQC